MPQSTIRILVVEDNPKYLQDVRQFMDERTRAGANVEAVFVSTLEDAKQELASGKYSAVLSDVFFPEKEGEPAEPTAAIPSDRAGELAWAGNVSGVKLAQFAMERGIPVTLCTSTHHHDSKTNPVNNWWRGKGRELIDSPPTEGEVEDKNWPGAFGELMYLRELIDRGIVEMTREGFKFSPAVQKMKEKNPEQSYGLLKNIRIRDESAIRFAAIEVMQTITNLERTRKINTTDPLLAELAKGPYKGIGEISMEPPDFEIFRADPKKYQEVVARGGPVRSIRDTSEVGMQKEYQKLLEQWGKCRETAANAWQELARLRDEAQAELQAEAGWGPRQ
ncbi:response regulator [Candidatus Uhrbacteria bacterium]|nr:response regulator [Candidatus Uhrbacteria bacterium]